MGRNSRSAASGHNLLRARQTLHSKHITIRVRALFDCDECLCRAAQQTSVWRITTCAKTLHQQAHVLLALACGFMRIRVRAPLPEKTPGAATFHPTVPAGSNEILAIT